MSRFLFAAAVLPLILSFSPAAPAPVAKPPAADKLPVPATALVVAQLHGVDRASERFKKLMQAAVPDLAATAAKKFEESLTDAANGRDLKALKQDGRIFIAVMAFAQADEGPPVAVLLPVTDYKAFKEKLLTKEEQKNFDKGKEGIDSFDVNDKPVYVVDLTEGGYVVLAQSKEVAKPFAKKYETLSPAKMGDGVAEAFLSADASVYFNMDQINDQYGDQIRQGRQFFQAILQQGAAVPGLDKNQLEMVKNMYEGMFQAVEDSRGFAIGVEFRPEGLNLRLEGAFASDTATSKFLAKESPTPAVGLADLPVGLSTYSAGRFGPRISEAAAKFARLYGAEDDDEKTAALVAKYLELLAAAQAEGTVAGGNIPDLSLAVFDSTAAVSADLVAAQVKLLKALKAGGMYQGVVLKDKPTVTEAAHKVEGFSFHEAKLSLDFEASTKHIPDENLRNTTIASMKRMVSEKPTIWFGTNGKIVIQMTAKDWPTAEKLLAGYLSGKDKVGTTAAFKATRSQLPASASMYALMDIGKLMVMLSDSFADMAKNIPGLPIGEMPKLKPSKEGPAYVGVAVALKPGAVRADLFVPVAAVKVGRDIVGPLLEKKDD